MENKTSIQIRLTKDQKRRLLRNIEISGAQTISQFVRNLILNNNTMKKMLEEIHEKIMEDSNG